MPAAKSEATDRVTFRFSREARLAEPAEFVALLRLRPAVRSKSFALYARHRAGALSWRFGLVIAKRFESRAVARNAIKRVWREALRAVAPDLENVFPSHDLVVRLLARPARADLGLLKQDCSVEANRLLAELRLKLPVISRESACAAPSSS